MRRGRGSGMIRLRLKPQKETQDPQPLGFDDYELRLGDQMRGERATMGKSLLDVQRELRIKAAYIAAIENCDPDAFDTPGFIAGYVRSYARYLNLDPEQAFAQFCAESGFSTAHGMSQEASGPSRKVEKQPRQTKAGLGADPLIATATPFVPAKESLFARVEPGALGSVAVLVALIGALGYGGWTVLTEVQKVQFAPVEHTPDVLSDLDPIQSAPTAAATPNGPELAQNFVRPAEGLDRLYRPEALDVPVLVARDAPIAQLNPAEIGAFAAPNPDTLPASESGSAEDRAVARALAGLDLSDEPGDAAAVPQVTEGAAPTVTLVAVRPAWVRVSGANGSVLFEKILNAGEEYSVPATEEPPVLRAGMSGSLYFKVGTEVYGPAGSGTTTVRDVALTVDAVSQDYAVADLSADPTAERVMLANARQLAAPQE